MVRYLIQASSNPREKMCSPNRLSAWVTQVVASLGGLVHSLDYTIGEADLVLLLEMPDDAAMAAFAELSSSQDKLKVVRVSPLITPDDASNALQKVAAPVSQAVPLPSLSPSAQDWERLGEGPLDCRR